MYVLRVRTTGTTTVAMHITYSTNTTQQTCAFDKKQHERGCTSFRALGNPQQERQHSTSSSTTVVVAAVILRMSIGLR